MGKEKKSSANASMVPGQPEKVQYHTPFEFHGQQHEESGRIYRLATKEDCYNFRCFADSLDGFTMRYNKENEVIVWDKKLPNEPMHVIKVFGVFASTPETPNGGATPRQLYDMLQDAIFREEWDDFRQEAFRIVKMDPRNDIGYYAGKSPVPLVAHRDFVNQRMFHEAGKEEYVIFNTSVPHAQVTPSYQKDVHKNKHGAYVRAMSKLTGYLIRPWTDPATGKVTGSCLTYITQTDPCGWIPTSLTNYISTKFAPKTIRNVAEALSQFPTWFDKQLKEGTYEKDWDLTPEWWIDEEEEKKNPVKNETIAFAVEKWGTAPSSSKKSSK